jgi:predicted transcriptional regulator
MNIENIRSKVADELLPLFDHTDKSVYLNVYDRDRLVRDIGSGVRTKEDLISEIQKQIGEGLKIDKNAFDEGRILKLTAPIDRENEKKNINQLRQKMQNIEELIELSDASAEKIREPESLEDTVQYKFIYLYNK